MQCFLCLYQTCRRPNWKQLLLLYPRVGFMSTGQWQQRGLLAEAEWLAKIFRAPLACSRCDPSPFPVSYNRNGRGFAFFFKAAKFNCIELKLCIPMPSVRDATFYCCLLMTALTNVLRESRDVWKMIPAPLNACIAHK